MPDPTQIQGLPAGATLKPIQGLPEGATLKPVSTPNPQANGAAPASGAQPNPDDQDKGVLHGLWNSTLGPMFDAAEKRQTDQDNYLHSDDHDFLDKVGYVLSDALKNSPPSMAYKTAASIVAKAYEQGKKTVQHGAAAAGHMGSEVSSLAHGDVQGAAAHGRAATSEMSEAAGHGLATAVPVVGPAAADTGEKFATKPKEATGEMIGQIGQVLLPTAAEGTAGKTAAKVEANAGVSADRAALSNVSKFADEQAANARQAADKANREAAATEASRKQDIITGRAKADEQMHAADQGANAARQQATTAEQQATQATADAARATTEAPANAAAENAANQVKARKGLVDSAQQATADALDRMNKTRTEGATTVGTQAGAQADTAAFQQARKELGEQATMSQVAQRAQEIKVANNGASGAGSLIDAQGEASKVHSFGEAADVIQSHAKPIYEALDKATQGRFSEIRDLLRKNKDAMFKDPMAMAASGSKQFTAEQEAGFLEKEMDHLFDSGAISKSDADAARQAWRTSKVLEDLHTVVERSVKGAPEEIAQASGASREIQGGQFAKRLNRMLEDTPKDQLESVLGKGGVDNLFKISDVVKDPVKAARFEEAAKNVARELTVKAKQAKQTASAAESAADAQKAHIKGVQADAERTINSEVAKTKGAAKGLGATADQAENISKDARQAVKDAEPPKETTGKAVTKFLGRKTLVGGTGAMVGAGAAKMVGASPYLGARVGSLAAITGDQALQYVFSKAMSSPKVGKLMRDAAKVGANSKVYAPAVAQEIRNSIEGDTANKKKGEK